MVDAASPHRLRHLWQCLQVPRERVLAVPMLPLLLAGTAGAMPITLVTMGYAAPAAAIAIGALLAAFTAILFRGKWRGLLVAMVIGLGVATLHTHAPWRTYPAAMLADEAFVQVEGIVIEHQLPQAEELLWVTDAARVEIAIRRLRLSRYEPWSPARGTILLRLHDGLLDELPERLRYGQRLHISGALQRPDSAAFPGAFDYRDYLRVQGIEHILRPATLTVVDAQPRGFRRGLATFYRLREALLQRVLGGHDQRGAAVLAAMTLGFRGGLTPEDRDLYVRSGMIHLFAISGLHVGVLFLLIQGLLMIIRVPFRSRYLLAPLLLLIYVVATGAAPSAMRAWLMLTVWSIGRASLRPTVSINAVLVAAAILLLLNPLYLYQPGFQFSFTIVLSLIWGWQQGGSLLRYAFEKQQWIPARVAGGRPWYQRLFRGTIKALLSMVAAWLGGIGLMAWYNQLFLPMSVLTNTVIFLLAFAILTLVVVKLLAILIIPWGLPALLTALLAGLLWFLRAMAITASEYGAVTLLPKPPLTAVLVYYLLLVLFFMTGRRLRAIWRMGTVLAIYIALLVLLPQLPSRHLQVHAMLPAGEHVPVIVIRYPYRRQPVLINAGSERFGYHLGTWLNLRGINTIDRVILLGTNLDAGGGLEELRESAPPRSIDLITTNRRNTGRSKLHAWQAAGAWHLHYRQQRIELPGLTIEPAEDGDADLYTLRIHDHRGHRATLTLRLEPYRGCTLTWTEGQDTAATRSHSFPYSDRHRIIRLTPHDSSTPSYR